MGIGPAELISRFEADEESREDLYRFYMGSNVTPEDAHYNTWTANEAIRFLERVWDYRFDPQTNVVDVLVCRLRSKIDKDFEPKLLHTLRGVGYVLKLP